MNWDSSSIFLDCVHHSFKILDDIVVGHIGSPGRVPTVVLNQSPWSPPTRTSDFALSLILRRISISLVPTSFHLKIAQITSCLIKSFGSQWSNSWSAFPFVLLSLQLASESGSGAQHFCPSWIHLARLINASIHVLSISPTFMWLMTWYMALC